MIDTHAHLDAGWAAPGELVARARAAGVTRIIAVGSGVESCRATLEIAREQEGVFAALGIHPHEAGGDDATRIGELGTLLDELGTLLDDELAVAVGETGLDYYRDRAPRDAQRRAFEAQLALASDRHLPVVVHSRAAAADTIEALSAFSGTVVLHCFSSVELLTPALERGYYVSFAGNVTYPNAHELREAAARVPADRILAETDSPYLAPQPVRGKRNEPAYVVHTVAALARARGEAADALAAQIDANAAVAFSLP